MARLMTPTLGMPKGPPAGIASGRVGLGVFRLVHPRLPPSTACASRGRRRGLGTWGQVSRVWDVRPTQVRRSTVQTSLPDPSNLSPGQIDDQAFEFVLDRRIVGVTSERAVDTGYEVAGQKQRRDCACPRQCRLR